jgi:acetyltransferase
MRRMFDPKTIAVIGASEREGSVGRTILENLMSGEGRAIMPVNPTHKKILGLKCYPRIGSIEEHVDLAIVAVPSKAVPDVLEECGQAAVAGAVVVSAGFSETGESGRRLEERISEISNRYHMRVLGPNCLGFMRPKSGLNASFLTSMPEPGKIALISQSGALGSAMLDWAINEQIGFSLFASLGAMVDIDFADVVDYLGDDAETRSILIYMESVGDAKRFLSAARQFARNKPIIVLKPGKFQESAKAALSHTGAMAGDDQVYDAGFRRAGVIRVKTVSELFNAAEVLDSRRLPAGPKVAIVTNAGGLGVMAVDFLLESGGVLAELSKSSIKHLNGVLPEYWSKSNPVDVLGDADSERYVEAIRTCLDDPDVNGLMVIYTPQGPTEPAKLAETVAKAVRRSYKPVLAVWMGGKRVEEAKDAFRANDVPCYDTPEDAVQTYMNMYLYSKNLELLYETPAELPIDEAPPKNNLRALIRKVAKSGRLVLTEEESKRFIANYGIPVSKQALANDLPDALRIAERFGYPVVLKIASQDISHKSAAGGVITEIISPKELEAAYEEVLERVHEKKPDARIQGVSVHKMVKKIDYELILGAKKDREFGSVVLFGMGGVWAEKFADFAVGLPPLNATLARRMMEDTRIYRAMEKPGGPVPPESGGLERIVASFANLIVDFPEIAEMDINPLVVSDGHICAVDARIVIDPEVLGGVPEYSHLAITPYPTRYVTPWKMTDGTEIILRPIKPEDEPLEGEMLSTLSPETWRGRFFETTGKVDHGMLIRFTNIDYDREMAIVAELTERKKRRLIGIGRLISEAHYPRAEFAVVVHDAYQGRGLGYKLVDALIGIAQEKGLAEIYGSVLSENRRMIKVCEELGFTLGTSSDGVTPVRLLLE